MPAIKLTAFRGEQPRIIPRLLDDSAAQSAYNVRLDDGGLTPMNSSVQMAELSAVNPVTIFKHQDTWLTWNKLVYAVRGAVATDRLYYTGDGAPKMRVNGQTYPLAVPRPTAAPVSALSGSGSGDTQTRLYTYTFVTDLGEESEPAPASNALDIKPGQTVTLSGIQGAPAGRLITKQRFYRSQTGSSGTFFYFVAERAASNANFVDTTAVDAFGEAMPSAAWNAPPDTLGGLISMPNGMMAAFSGQSLYFCEPYRPHAWPEKYVLKTDSPIVGLGALGTTLIVMTKGQPYIAQGTTPDTMQMVKIEANYPCINPRGIVDLGFAIAYPSNEGLIRVTGDGVARLVTGKILSKEDWLDLGPSTIIGAQLGGLYMAFYDVVDAKGVTRSGSIFFDVSDSPQMLRADTMAKATYFELETSSLYYMAPNDKSVYRFDSPDGARMEYYWRSKVFYMPYPMSYAAIQVDTDRIVSPRAEENYRKSVAGIKARNAEKIAAKASKGPINAAPLNAFIFNGDELERIPSPDGTIMVGVYADGVQVAQIRSTNSPARLPAKNAGTKWEIDVRSNIPVTQVVMATSIAELRKYL